MKLNTKTGRLTAYGFACGYIETRTTRNHLETEIWQECGRYHVRQYSFDSLTWGGVFWECFDTLAEARNLFNRQPGRLSKSGGILKLR